MNVHCKLYGRVTLNWFVVRKKKKIIIISQSINRFAHTNTSFHLCRYDNNRYDRVVFVKIENNLKRVHFFTEYRI